MYSLTTKSKMTNAQWRRVNYILQHMYKCQCDLLHTAVAFFPSCSLKSWQLAREKRVSMLVTRIARLDLCGWIHCRAMCVADSMCSPLLVQPGHTYALFDHCVRVMTKQRLRIVRVGTCGWDASIAA